MGLHSHQDTFIGPKFRKQRDISTVAPLFLELVLSSNHQNPQEIIKLSSKQNKILKTKKNRKSIFKYTLVQMSFTDFRNCGHP